MKLKTFHFTIHTVSVISINLFMIMLCVTCKPWLTSQRVREKIFSGSKSPSSKFKLGKIRNEYATFDFRPIFGMYFGKGLVDVASTTKRMGWSDGRWACGPIPSKSFSSSTNSDQSALKRPDRIACQPNFNSIDGKTSMPIISNRKGCHSASLRNIR